MSNLPRLILAFIVLSAEVSFGQMAAPCGIRSTGSSIITTSAGFVGSLREVPREAIRKDNLKWEIPLAAATGVLVGVLDRPAADRIQSTSLQHTAGRWSNIGLGIGLGTAGMSWVVGCATHHSYAAESGFRSLEAAGLALTLDLALKEAFNRQYPYGVKSTAEFWEGGKSFPSGHAATSFAAASAMAHRYPHHPWVKWGSYALATGVSIARYPAKKHYPSDILIGAPIGYLVGAYIANHQP